jgi:16S rRNA processing protein RimM
LLAGESEERPLIVSSSRPNRGRVLVSFEGVADRDAAEALRGTYLFVPASEAPALPEDEFWPHELIGCEVVTQAGRPLGHVREVIRTPANDVWSVRARDGRDLLVPALKDVVVEVDVEAGRIEVREVPGLTSP